MIVNSVHDFSIVVCQLYKCVLSMIFQEDKQRLIFKEDALLKNLEVCFWLPEIVHLRHEKSSSSSTDFEFKFFKLWLNLL